MYHLETLQKMLYDRNKTRTKCALYQFFILEILFMKMEILFMKKRRGYLHNNYQLFYLKDQQTKEIEEHYHEFPKIVVFISGKASYLIEGCTYELQPYDILLIHQNDIHKPLIDLSLPYERYILWVDPAFLHSYSQKSSELLACFQIASQNNLHLLRLKDSALMIFQSHIKALHQELMSSDFGSEIMADTFLFQIMVQLNRELLSRNNAITSYNSDPRIQSLIQYIRDHLEQPLSIPALANQLYVSPSYLMHLFRQETGMSLHQYITRKRIQLAASRLKEGIPATEVCFSCGFQDYSTFSRAFKKIFKTSPGQYNNS